MVQNRLNDAGVMTVVHKEEPLAKPPQRCGTELIRTRQALVYAICKGGAHVMQGEIREGCKVGIGKGGCVYIGAVKGRVRSGIENIGMAQNASDADLRRL